MPFNCLVVYKINAIPGLIHCYLSKTQLGFLFIAFYSAAKRLDHGCSLPFACLDERSFGRVCFHFHSTGEWFELFWK